MILLRTVITIFFTILSVAVLADAAYEDYYSSGYQSCAAEFLKLPSTAATAGLSNAVTAMEYDFQGLFINPSLCMKATTINVNGTYGYFTLDRNFLSVSICGPFNDYIAFCGTVNHLSVANIEERDSLRTFKGTFGDNENAFAISLAGAIKWNISWGIRCRYLNQQIGKFGGANGIGFDIGLHYKPFQILSIGLSGNNLMSCMWWNTGAMDTIKPVAHAGISITIPDSSLLCNLDIEKILNQPIEVAAGIQYLVLGFAAFRAGIRIPYDYYSGKYPLPDFSLGAGLKNANISIDYGITIPSSELGFHHYITLAFIFD